MMNLMADTGKNVITRFPPSPTGFLHIGGARTALFNYLFARKNEGKMVFRLEDTDRERSKPEFEKNILESLAWLGISYNNEPVRQSERSDIYKAKLKALIDAGKAYVSKEEAQEGKRGEVIRFKNPNTRIKFNDLIRGEVEFDTTELKDFVIAKSLEEPLYHLAVVVDDIEMGVTHVIRGEDHISNTPRQILLIEALGASRPIYAHIPLILAPDRSKMSKRHGAVSVTEYRDRGYLPEAVINYLALLGWNPGTEKEIFTMEELVKEFDLKRVHKAGAIFSLEKLNWVNREHLRMIPQEKIAENVKKYMEQAGIKIDNQGLEKILPLILERMNYYGEVPELFTSGELKFFGSEPEYEARKLVWKNSNAADTKKYLEKVIEILSMIDEEKFNQSMVKEMIWSYAESEGRGEVLWPMRYALSGQDRSPDPFVLAGVLGKSKSLERLKKAIAKL
jgi:glutamyl-tRNA synthetase